MKLGPANIAVTKRIPEPAGEAGGSALENASRAAERASAAKQRENASGRRIIRLRKSDTTLRELKMRDEIIELEIESELGGNAYKLAHDISGKGTELFVASCANVGSRDLRRCVAKVTSDLELAYNEWDHLVNIRSSAFPAAFVLGKLVDAEGRPWLPERAVIVMELIEGETLSALIERGFGESGDPAPVEKALEIMSPLAAAFRDLELSLHPFVHRDVKPDNIIITSTGGKRRTRMIDLGIASHRGDPLQRIHLGCSAGFAAPEIACPHLYPSDEIFSIDDTRIDTYGLAATFCVLATGYVPNAGEKPVKANRLVHDRRILSKIEAAAKQAIYKKHLIDADDELIEDLLAHAVKLRDEALAEVINGGLTFLQSKRPTPAAFFEALPTNYQSTLVNDVHLLFLEHLATAGGASGEKQARAIHSVDLRLDDSVDLSGTALDDAYRYPNFKQDFHHAMELYNSGRYDEAVPLLMRLDEAGDPTSSYNLGVCYKDGLGGLPQDDAHKLACWLRAAEGGHIMAIYNVGVCHEEGSGIPVGPESQAAAISWYESAVKAGLPAAAARLEKLRAQLAQA